jgi:hypothetical protein
MLSRLLILLLLGFIRSSQISEGEDVVSYYPSTTTTGGVVLSATSAYPQLESLDDLSDHSDPDSYEPHPVSHGDTAVVQNNYNIKMEDGKSRVTPQEIFIYTVGSLTIIGLFFGVVILGIIMIRLLSDDERKKYPFSHSSMSEARWKHDPVYDMPMATDLSLKNKHCTQQKIASMPNNKIYVIKEYQNQNMIVIETGSESKQDCNRNRVKTKSTQTNTTNPRHKSTQINTTNPHHNPCYFMKIIPQVSVHSATLTIAAYMAAVRKSTFFSNATPRTSVHALIMVSSNPL